MSPPGTREREGPDEAWARALEAESLYHDGRPLSAIREYNRALELSPESAPFLYGISLCYLATGQTRAAVDAAYRAHLAEPGMPAFQANLLTTLLYAPQAAPEDIFDAYRQWGEQFPPVAAAVEHKRHELVRIGYLSSNFCTNAEVYFLEPVLRGHDRSRFEVFCYSIGSGRDEWTAKLRGLAGHWRDLSEVSDEPAAEVIRRDEIDILADCSGHFSLGLNRILARRPAPVQVSLPTYPATTGLKAVDFRITDCFADPDGVTDSFHTEKLIRLPGSFCCYRPPDDTPDVSELPAARNGYITFASFNRFEKINHSVIDLWAEILRLLPEARLFFHHVFDGRRNPPPEHCENLVRAFHARGIASTRLSFAGARPVPDHLALFQYADISLDPFPYAGMTTTCESLWMGVPVVTLAGRAHVGRVGVSLLNAVGLPDWVASSAADYVRLAVSKAGDLPALCQLRLAMRERMRRSSLTDASRYARSLEQAYLSMLPG